MKYSFSILCVAMLACSQTLANTGPPTQAKITERPITAEYGKADAQCYLKDM